MRARVKKSRRDFLEALFCFGSLGMLRPAVALETDSEAPARVAGRRLAALLGDRRSARIVGREYLRAFPHEADLHFLLDSLCTPAQSKVIAQAIYDHADIARIIGNGQQSDFERHRTVNVRGWVLSRTECRLCALCTLV